MKNYKLLFRFTSLNSALIDNFVNSGSFSVTAGGNVTVLTGNFATDFNLQLSSNKNICIINGIISLKVATAGVTAAGWKNLFSLANSNMPNVSKSYNSNIDVVLASRSDGSIYGQVPIRLAFTANSPYVIVQAYFSSALSSDVSFGVCVPPCQYAL